MADSAAAEARRRRQERIKASQADRLSKITGRPVELPSQPESTSEGSSTSILSSFTDDAASNESTANDFEEDPLFRLLKNIQSGGDDGSVRTQAAPLDDFFGMLSSGESNPFASSLKASLNRNKSKIPSADAVPEVGGSDLETAFSQLKSEPRLTSSERRFLIIRSVLMALAAIYVLKFPQRLWMTLISIELVLTSVRFFSGLVPKIPLLQTISMQLPPRFQQRVRLATIGYASVQTAWQDLLILLFVYGIMNWNQGTSPTSLYFRD